MTQLHRSIRTAGVLALLLCALLATAPAAAENTPSSDLLLPYFEVQLDGPGLTTLFAVVNSSRVTVPVEITVHSNWGLEILQVPLELGPSMAHTVNLRDWLVNGTLPGEQLDAATLGHVQAALCGQESPEDGLFYSTEIRPRTAVGYVEIRVTGRQRADVLLGDYFVVDPSEDFAQGERLISIDRGDACGYGLCRRHALRFLEGGGFDSGTELIVWTPRRLTATSGTLAGETTPVVLDATAYEEPGASMGSRNLGTLPVQVLKVSDLGFDQPFGWLDLTTSEDSFMAVRYSAGGRYSVALQSVCLELEDENAFGVRIEKATNGHDADAAPGPFLAEGEPVVWEYVVTNTGPAPLVDVAVRDDDESLTVVCPRDSLQPGESMTCTAEGVAGVCGYTNLGSVVAEVDTTGDPVLGDLPVEAPAPVRDADRSHYFGLREAALEMAVRLNGEDASTAPFPHFVHGTSLHWEVEVTNSGAADLADVVVDGAPELDLDCPATALAAGDSMVCTADGVSVEGGAEITARATGTDSCGVDAVATGHARYLCGECAGNPSVSLQKATNGHDADLGPGPEIAEGDAVTWTYVATNTGDLPLRDVAVGDDDPALSVSCPKDALDVGEAMTCTAHGSAVKGAYSNLGSVTAVGGEGVCERVVDDEDPSHYHNTPDEEVCSEGRSVALFTEVQGQAADAAPGYAASDGESLSWTYRVVNDGDVPLSAVQVTQSGIGGMAVSCPGDALAVGAEMTCTASSSAEVGTFASLGSVSAAAGAPPVEGCLAGASDPAYYTVEPDDPTGEGCTPGYWKNHTDSWPATGFSPAQSVESVFAAAAVYPAVGSASLLDALGFGGGPSVEDAARTLLRAAVAALLDASHAGVAYPRSQASVIADTDAALASGDRGTLLALAGSLDADNNLGCPLS